MLKKKLSLLLCTLMITGCFTQSAFADEIKTNALPKNETTVQTKDSINNNIDKKSTEAETVPKENLPKVDFEMLSSQEAFDINFHNLSYQESLMNKCLKQQTKLKKYSSTAIPMALSSNYYNNSFAGVGENRTYILFTEFLIENSKLSIKQYESYKASNKNLSEDALNILNQYIIDKKDLLLRCEKSLKEYINAYNKALKETRSYETSDTKNDYENLMISDIMDSYCRRDTVKFCEMLKSTVNSTPNDITKNLVDDLKGKPLTVSTAVPKQPDKNQNSAVTKIKSSSTSAKSLPKTGGFDAGTIASVSLILSGATLALVNQLKKH